MKIKFIIESILAFFGFRQSDSKTIKKPNNDNNSKMDIGKGFQIDNPNIFVYWNIDEKTLMNLFENSELKYITTGY